MDIHRGLFNETLKKQHNILHPVFSDISFEGLMRGTAVKSTWCAFKEAIADTYPASASVPVVEQQPAWRQSMAPDPAHEQPAAGSRKQIS